MATKPTTAPDSGKGSKPRNFVKLSLCPTTRARNKFGPDIYQRILMLRWKDDHSPRQIARELGCGKTMVYKVLSSSLEKIKSAHLN